MKKLFSLYVRNIREDAMDSSNEDNFQTNCKTQKGKCQNNFQYKQEDSEVTCCFCFKTRKSKKKNLVTGIVTNIGIFALLLAYTLLGAFVFLAIEGSAAKMHQKTLATTSLQQHIKTKQQKILAQQNSVAEFNNSIAQATEKLRSQTVENIWEITVSLNILYKDNWTRLAAEEIARFQDKLVQKVTTEMTTHYALGQERVLESMTEEVPFIQEDYEWNFAKAFLYSLTVLTTIGYGSVAPRTGLGKAVTIGYAVLGIPLTLLYLSVIGSLLSKLARSVFSKALCCCLCSKCGYCCYDEMRMADKERKKKIKRQEIDYHNQSIQMQEPYYVRSPSGTIISASQAHHASMNSVKDKQSFGLFKECDSISCTDSESKTSLRGLSILAPVVLCLAMIFSYIMFGAIVLHHLEDWNLVDGIYFCFMSLSTIGFGNLVPGSGVHYKKTDSNITIWFCSVFIMTGLALTAMCFNVLHDEIIHRLKHHENMMKENAHKVVPPPEYHHES